MLADRIMPFCERGHHYCANLCLVARGQPCKPPTGSWWRPHPGPAQRYQRMRMQINTAELTDKQYAVLCWLAGWDDDVADNVAEFIRLGGQAHG